jgi:SAM-dependent methyltransferase
MSVLDISPLLAPRWLDRIRLATRPSNRGYCAICEQNAIFVMYGEWLRDEYRCRACGSIPRNRALANALNRFYPTWRTASIHESSPGGPLSDFLSRHCRGYSSSHFYDDIPRGQKRGPHQSEDLSALTFGDAEFDIFVTSDVFEHVMTPSQAFAEIARVLRPGGIHIFTMPWYPTQSRTVQRARLRPDLTIEHLLEPEYHGNPIDNQGSLVTFDWGADFTDFVLTHSGLSTTVYLEIDRAKGLDGEFLEVFISRKPAQMDAAV